MPVLMVSSVKLLFLSRDPRHLAILALLWSLGLQTVSLSQSSFQNATNLPATEGKSDRNELGVLYQKAREAYATKRFTEAATLFRRVSSACAGSELSLQCEYYALLSEWGTNPSDKTASEWNDWLIRAAKFQTEANKLGQAYDRKLIGQWTDHAIVLSAKWDRQKEHWDQAEQKLRTYIAKLGRNSDASGVETCNPAIWLELGSLLLDGKQDYQQAEQCFANAIETCNQNSHSQASAMVAAQATWGLSLVGWHQRNYDEAARQLKSLNFETLDDNLKIQAKLLEVKLAKARQESIAVARELEPLVNIALAGNPQADLLYQLALALIAAGEKTNSRELLIQITRRFPNTPISLEANVRLARDAVQQKNWKETVTWCEQAMACGENGELTAHAQWMLGQAKLELGSVEEAKATLQIALDHDNLDADLQLSIRFHLAEALYQLEKWNEAEQHWQWLIAHASKSTDANQVAPSWLSTLLLRQAELHAFRKDWAKAESAVLRICNDFPECNRRCEVDYLLARCLVSKADFDGARGILDSIVKRSGISSSELMARAYWMAGETYLMQRRFEEARSQYLQALNIPAQSYWHSAALLQIGQCCEAMQDRDSARRAYQDIIDHHGEGPFATVANERLSKIPAPTLANQSKPDSVGTKR